MHDETPGAALMRLVNGHQISQAIAAAAEFGIADRLTDGPRQSEALAATAGCNPGALYRLLRALAAVGVFHEAEGGWFSLTPVGACLRTDAPGGIAPWAILAGRPYLRRAWDGLLYGIRSGETAFPHVHGCNVWDYRARHPEEGALFDRALAGISAPVGAAVAAAGAFERFGCAVDVGGGNGALLAAILATHPHLRGVLLDRAQVVAGAGPVLEQAGVAGRCTVVAGDFFADLPRDGDAYLLKAILHDWPDEACQAILRSCRRAMRPDATLMVVERLIAPPNQGAEAKFSDLTMLVVPGGRERTQGEFAALLAAAGFRIACVRQTGTRMSVIEAQPVSIGE